jgi:hypothetical protein
LPQQAAGRDLRVRARGIFPGPALLLPVWIRRRCVTRSADTGSSRHPRRQPTSARRCGSARLFVDGASTPQLTATLKRPWARGMVGFWGSFGGANVSNLVVTPADTAAPAAPPAEPPPPRQILTAWELSAAYETAQVRPDVPAPGGAAWTPVVAESSGLVNIARYRASVRTAASPCGRRARSSGCRARAELPINAQLPTPNSQIDQLGSWELGVGSCGVVKLTRDRSAKTVLAGRSARCAGS